LTFGGYFALNASTVGNIPMTCLLSKAILEGLSGERWGWNGNCAWGDL
jgi:hypothetical protein